MTEDEHVRELLTKVIGLESFEGRDELLSQVDHVRVVGGPITFHELAVDRTAPRSPIETRMVPGAAWAYEGNEPVGTLIVWVDDGYISALEYGWVTDEPPNSLPSTAQVRRRC